jgi:UDP-N-acetyl-D-galactosamine dehydrogenase
MQKIAIVGLGYVGLPLAVEFGKNITTIGYDVNEQRINELKNGFDRTLETTSEELGQSSQLSFAKGLGDIVDANIYIVTVPTPIDEYKNPDLTPLQKASEALGSVLKVDDIVIYESTVFPGCTEEVCVPILEKISGLKFNKDFYCGYSPERINPGDKLHRLPTIKKVTSGSTPEVANIVDELYKSIITAGTHKANSIKVAEAAKVIENSQRDLNIAFVNELALIFDKLGIDTHEVLEAAGTKWNFLPFKPGLVGGHCIGVDPYYLTHKAESVGYRPEVILAGRRINDNMGAYIASTVVKMMIQKSIPVKNERVLILGITFKEDCPDIRNSKVIDVIKELQTYGVKVEIYDPLADKKEVKLEYGVELIDNIDFQYQSVIMAVCHKEFDTLDWSEIKTNEAIVYDIKGKLDPSIVTKRL